MTSREDINMGLRGVLDEATGKWGIRVNRVEIKAIDPPASVQQAMEMQMRAEREKRAAILTAEGVRQSAILTAEGAKQSEILRAEGDARAAVVRAEGEASAIATVFEAIHTNDPDPKLLAYQYLQSLPAIANGASNKLWILPAELTQAMTNLSQAFASSNSSESPPSVVRLRHPPSRGLHFGNRFVETTSDLGRDVSHHQDVPVRVVVVPQRVVERTRSGTCSVGAQVLGCRVDGIGGIPDVLVPIFVTVDRVCHEGARQELHRALRPCRRGTRVGAVPTFHLADGGQNWPGQPWAGRAAA